MTDRCITDPTDPHYDDPWPTFVRALTAALDGIPTARPPAGTFRGRNMMADEIVSTHRAAAGGWVEVSYGRGIGNDYITGLSFRGHPGDEHKTGHVETFTDPAAAAERLRELVAP